MEFWIKASQLLLSLSFLIVLHELGHFIPAKLFKTRVEKFYLFFNPWFALWKVKRGETEYGLGWLPLGGYVKISGMIDESMDKDQMDKPAEPWEFRSKPVWQRLIIMLGGVTVNLILGFVIYMMIMGVWGRDYLPPENMSNGYDVPEFYEKYGFEDGDIVLAVDGEPLKDALDINRLILLKGATKFKVRHADGRDTTIVLPDDIDFKAFQAEAALRPRQKAVIDSVFADTPAKKAGFKKGDRILAVNGEKVGFWNDMTNAFAKIRKNRVKARSQMFEEGESLMAATQAIEDQLGPLSYNIKVKHKNGDVEIIDVQPNAEGQIGILPLMPKDEFKIKHASYSFFASIPAGFDHAATKLHDYVAQLKYLGTSKGVSSLGGFGTFGSLFAPEWDWYIFWERTAFISIILAFMNILPIPALDGGHVMFLLYEMIAGRPPNQKFLEYAQIIGLVLLLSLVLYANANDIIRAI